MIDIKEATSNHITFLYELLKERDPDINISHRTLPAFEDHKRFFESKPYNKWYVIYNSKTDSGILFFYIIGSVYITKTNEIGIQILKRYQNQGYGGIALKLLMEKCKRDKYYANISPHNFNSFLFFVNNGFNTIQWTLTKENL